ncbi:hypothetical protein GALL_268850 [mine drainage metagenome]|uniref:Uncharacterized protein n=1 Tax=mine drainage metagenome TaxID=410659 RepID=A0A1J5RGU8_9ZZZZ
MVDQGRHPGIGDAQDRPAGFERAHLDDLQPLADGEAALEPGQVAGIDQQAGLRQPAAKIPADQILVADQGADARRSKDQRPLPGQARTQILQRDIERRGKPGEAGGSVFAEGHQPHLVVARDPARVRSDLDDAVVARAIGRCGGDAEQQVAAASPAEVLQFAQDVAGQVVQSYGEGRLRRHDQIGAALFDQSEQALQLPAGVAGIEFPMLLHVRLDQPVAKRRPGRAHPGDAAQDKAAGDQHCDNQGAGTKAASLRQQRQRCAQSIAETTEAIDADDRRVAGQGSVGEAVAQRQ